MSLRIVASIFASVFIFLLPTLPPPPPVASIGEYVRFHWLVVWQHLAWGDATLGVVKVMHCSSSWLHWPLRHLPGHV